MNAPQRRGACPGLSAPMLTGDGLLVRLSLTDSIALDALREICAAARRHGNGTIEITTRGSLQVRGLTARSADAFADAVAAHTTSGVPLSAFGHGASLFGGTMDNTEVFFRVMQGVLGGVR